MKSDQEKPQRHRWPWYVLGFLVVFVVLSVYAILLEAARVRRIREANPRPAFVEPGLAATNAPGITS